MFSLGKIFFFLNRKNSANTGKAVTSKVPHTLQQEAEGPATPSASAPISMPTPCRAVGGQGWEQVVQHQAGNELPDSLGWQGTNCESPK